MNMHAPLTEDINDICFWDTETRGLDNLADPRWGDVTISGARRYGTSCKVTIFVYAIGDGPVKRWYLKDFDKTLLWRDAPPDLLKHLARALKGEAWFAAFNSFFDRNVSNNGMKGEIAQTLPIRTVIDVMGQAVASNLPAKLDGAARAVKHQGKLENGKALIQLFAPAGGATPQSHPEEWQLFLEYADMDIDAMRTVYKSTRPLWRWEWEQFWTSEHINDIGLPIDSRLCRNAGAMATVYAAKANELVAEFSRDACWSVNQHVALAKWVADEVGHLPEAADMLVKKYTEDEEGDGLVPSGLSLDRPRVEKLIAFLEARDRVEGLTDDEFDVLQLLEVRLYGASATPKKFSKLLPMLDEDERLGGQYTWNGAQQTGRYSSRGVQVHNLTRAFLGIETDEPEQEAAAIEFLCDLGVGE